MSTQFYTTSLQLVWSLISHSRVCEHDLTVTLTLLCTCTHCVNVTVFSSCMWSSHVTGFSVDPPLTAHRLQVYVLRTNPMGTNTTSIFVVLSASSSTCSEFHLLFLTTRCSYSVTVLSTKSLCCNTIPSVHSFSILNECSE